MTRPITAQAVPFSLALLLTAVTLAGLDGLASTERSPHQIAAAAAARG